MPKVFQRERTGGVARTPTTECFGGRELGALHAHRQQSVSEGENWGRCAHTNSRVFRRERTRGVARTPITKYFRGKELWAFPCTSVVECFRGKELRAFRTLTEAG
jgi:hypothetical protein